MGEPNVGEEPEEQQDQQATDEHRDHTPDHEDRILSITAISAVVNSVITEQRAGRDQHERHESSKRTREWTTISAIAATAIIALLTLVITHCDTERVIREAQESARVQHADTVAAIAAANRANEISQKSFAADKRAFVFMRGLSHGFWDEKFPSTTFTPIWRNSGGTPAQNLMVWDNCQMGNSTKRLPFENRSNESRFLLGPSSEQGITACGVESVKIRDLTEGRHFYIFGGARYVDIFGTWHKSEFCFQASPSVPMKMRHLPPGSLDPEALKDRLSHAHA